MKTGKKLFLVLMFGWVALFSTTASAQWCWYRCTIDSAGPEGADFFYVTLTGNEINGTTSLSGDRFSPFVWLTKDQKNVMIATILSAVTAGKTVDVLVYIGIEPSLFAVYINP